MTATSSHPLLLLLLLTHVMLLLLAHLMLLLTSLMLLQRRGHAVAEGKVRIGAEKRESVEAIIRLGRSTRGSC